jgi:hypothetical protein
MKISKHIIIAIILTGFIILPNLSLGQEEENRDLGIIVEMSEDGNIIQVGNRSYIVVTVFIDDGTKEEPVPGFSYNLQLGSVVEVVYNGPHKSFMKAKEIIAFTGEKKEVMLAEMERAGKLRMYNLDALGLNNFKKQ